MYLLLTLGFLSVRKRPAPLELWSEKGRGEPAMAAAATLVFRIATAIAAAGTSKTNPYSLNPSYSMPADKSPSPRTWTNPHASISQRFCRTLALMNTQNSHTWAVIPQQSPNLCRIMTPQPPRGYPSRIPTTGRRLWFLPFDRRPKIPRPLRTLQPTVAFSPVRRSSVAS